MPGQFQTFPSGVLYVHDFGGSGTPIVAVHGLGGFHLNWLPVAAGLTRQGRLIAPDLPGFGYSPPRSSYSIASHARAVNELLESIGEPSILMGNSLGGLVTIEVARQRPDLVKRLVLVAPAGPPNLSDERIDRVVAKRLVIQGLPGFGPYFVNRYWKSTTPAQQMSDTLAVVCAHPERISQDVVEPTLALATARRRQPWALDALVKSGRSAGLILLRKNRLRQVLVSIPVPGLIIQGAKDRVVAGSGVEWIASVRPDWDLVVMEDCGHCPQLEAPERFVDIYDSWVNEPASEAS
jgi:pimeloyl-ACP methyl ester carboxylesterase